MVTKAFVK